MEDLILQPAALDLLEVGATATGPADPEFYIFREWCAMMEVERSAALLNQQDLTGIMYLNTDLEFQAIFYHQFPCPPSPSGRVVCGSIKKSSEPRTRGRPIQLRRRLWCYRSPNVRALRKRARITVRWLSDYQC